MKKKKIKVTFIMSCCLSFVFYPLVGCSTSKEKKSMRSNQIVHVNSKAMNNEKVLNVSVKEKKKKRKKPKNSSSNEKGKLITATGWSEISFSAAERDAQRNAVRKGAETHIVDYASIENSELIKSIIISKSKGYLLNYEIIKRDKDKEKGIYLVTISASVTSNDIKNDINEFSIIYKGIGQPNISVFIKERYIDFTNDDISKNKTSNFLITELRNHGFTIVDVDYSDNALVEESIRLFLDGNNLAPHVLNLFSDTEFLIVGDANIENKTNFIDPDFKSIFATLTLKVIHTQTGRIIGSGDIRKRAIDLFELAGAEKALKKAARIIVREKIADEIIASWRDAFFHGQLVSIYVTGKAIKDYIGKIEEYFESLDKVSDFKFPGWNGISGILSIEFRYLGLCRELESAIRKKDFAFGRLILENRNTCTFNFSFHP